MEIKKAIVNPKETAVEIDLFSDLKISKAAKKEIGAIVGDFLVEQTIASINEQRSPISGGGTFKALTPAYKKRKIEEVGHGNPDLQVSGEMLDSLSYKVTDTGIKFGVFGAAAPRADGHNNLSGESRFPADRQRRFLPAEGETYKTPIVKEIKRIISDELASRIKPSDFSGVTDRAGLYEVLRGKLYPDLSRAEITLAVFRNEDLLSQLRKLGLVGFL